MTDIKAMIENEMEKISSIRRALHQIPEKGFAEKKTARFIAEHLKTIPELEVFTGIAGTGVLGLLKTGRPGKTLVIRADMDALPISEETGLEFASTHENMMHACGHDAHMTMTLVAAGILARLREHFSGNIKFMFQPAEEGPGGAKPMIDSLVLENPHVDYSVACHVWPGLPAGTLGLKSGVLMAAASSFKINIKGKGGHGAMPHLCVDAIDTAIQVANALQRVVTRKLNPLIPSVVTIGSFHAGSAPNIISENAELRGTIRTFDKQTWKEYPEIFKQIIDGVCAATGAAYEFSSSIGVPPLESDPGIVNIMKKSMLEVVPGDRIKEPESTMGAEDMALVLEKTKGCYFFLGTGFMGCPPLHNAQFDYDESLLLLGVETFVRFALNLLTTVTVT
ncbi:M20 family metallopeptidase [Desulfobacula sp.]|uniref:M20 metallopeptidase family protein n=1 Tax=Desulfobacula sp. TaxID=2593537 RepID=UPI00262E5148|nr:M20 family metallopeptidase [Desulfobacula sp.]